MHNAHMPLSCLSSARDDWPSTRPLPLPRSSCAPALYKALVEPFNLKDATKCSKQDWSADCKGAKVMSRELLKDSIFELTDTWTRTVDPREYFSFMRTLFSAITRGDPPSLIPLDQISACTSLIDGSFDEEGNAHTAELLAAFDQAFVETDSQAKAAAEQAAAEQAEAEKRILAGLDPCAAPPFPCVITLMARASPLIASRPQPTRVRTLSMVAATSEPLGLMLPRCRPPHAQHPCSFRFDGGAHDTGACAGMLA